MGSTNSDLSKIFSIQNQTEFAKTYKTEKSTLTNWNKLIDREDLIKDTLEPAKRPTKNVLFALYRKAIKTGNAEEVRLWFQYVEGWRYQSAYPKEQRAHTVAKINYATGMV